MNKGSVIDPITIIPIIKHIEKKIIENKIIFLDKENNYLKFVEDI